MNVIACVDDNMGLLFNNRRQSQDKKVIEKVFEIANGGHLMINNFSEKLFNKECFVSETFLDDATETDFCFVENVSLAPYKEKIDMVYLFRWNRNYPFDFTFNLQLENSFQLMSSEEFEGNSHENITLEVWTK